MKARLAPGISYTSVDGVTVVLDLLRDRYVRLGPDAAAALDALAAGTQSHGDFEKGFAALTNAGIIECEEGQPIAPARLDRPERSAVEVASADTYPVGLIEIALANFRIRWSLSRKGLAQTVTTLRRLRAQASFRDDEAIAIGIAQRYAGTRRLLPGDHACLADAFMVSLLLTRYGILHDVAFGVSLGPFAAHAWAQTDRHILSDRADPIRAFVPVFKL